MDALIEWWQGLGSGSTRLVASIILVAVLIVVRWLVLRAVRAQVERGESLFRARKWIAYAVTAIGFLGLVQIWLGGVGGITTYLGILSAGIAIALADVLESLAGWLFIVLRRPFKVGDRVEIEGRVGDVVDIRAFRFSMLEIGNWVDADQSTGRLVHVPNGKVFTTQLINYTEGFPYIWEEVVFLVTFESDWKRAEELMREALAATVPGTEDGTIRRAIERAGHEYLIRYTHLAPTTYISVKDSGVQIAGRYLVAVRNRRGVEDRLWRAILDAIAAEASVDLAYPTTRIYLADQVRYQRVEDTSG